MKLFKFLGRHIKLLIVLLFVILLAVGAFIFYKVKLSKKTDVSTSDLRMDRVVQQDISNYVSMTGTITANESQSVYATLNGLEVMEVKVKVGDKVNKGDVIAVLDSSDYEHSLETAQKQLEVDEAKTNLKVQIASENLQDAQVDGLDSWKEGEIDIAQANTDLYYSQISYQQACEDLSYAKEVLQRAKDDAQEQIDELNSQISKLKRNISDLNDEIDDKKASGEDTSTLESEKRSLKSEKESKEDQRDELQAKLDDPNYGFSSETKSVQNAERSVQNAQQNIEKTQRNVNDAVEKHADNAENQRRKIQDASESQTETNLDASVAQNSQKDKIEELQKQVDSCTITAPLTGVVTSVSMEAGNTVSNDNNTICVIQDTSSYKVEGTIDEYDIAKISEGMAAVIKTEATDDVEMKGTVSFVSPTPQSSSGGSGSSSSSSSSVVYPVKISIDSIDDSVRIGMTAETNVLLESAENVLTVPYDCIGKNDDGDYVVYAVEGSKDMAEAMKAAKANASSKPSSDSKSGGSGNKPSGGFGGPMGGGPGGSGNMPGDTSSGLSAEDIGKEIVVEVGLIADYYVEISSDELTDGMMVYVPSESAISIDNGDDDSSSGGGFGGPGGGGPMGGGPGGF